MAQESNDSLQVSSYTQRMLAPLFLVFKSLEDVLHIFTDTDNILRKGFSLNVSDCSLSYVPLFRRRIPALSLCKTALAVDGGG